MDFDFQTGSLERWINESTTPKITVKTCNAVSIVWSAAKDPIIQPIPSSRTATKSPNRTWNIAIRHDENALQGYKALARRAGEWGRRAAARTGARAWERGRRRRTRTGEGGAWAGEGWATTRTGAWAWWERAAWTRRRTYEELDICQSIPRWIQPIHIIAIAPINRHRSTSNILTRATISNDVPTTNRISQIECSPTASGMTIGSDHYRAETHIPWFGWRGRDTHARASFLKLLQRGIPRTVSGTDPFAQPESCYPLSWRTGRARTARMRRRRWAWRFRGWRRRCQLYVYLYRADDVREPADPTEPNSHITKLCSGLCACPTDKNTRAVGPSQRWTNYFFAAYLNRTVIQGNSESALWATTQCAKFHPHKIASTSISRILETEL